MRDNITQSDSGNGDTPEDSTESLTTFEAIIDSVDLPEPMDYNERQDPEAVAARNQMYEDKWKGAHNRFPRYQTWRGSMGFRTLWEEYLYTLGGEVVTDSDAKKLVRNENLVFQPYDHPDARQTAGNEANRPAGEWNLNERFYADAWKLNLPRGLLADHVETVTVRFDPADRSWPRVELWIILESGPQTAKILMPHCTTVRINRITYPCGTPTRGHRKRLEEHARLVDAAAERKLAETSAEGR